MPNGKPGDHPLTDITVHRMATFSEEADDLVRELVERAPDADWWSFLHSLYEKDGSFRVAGSDRQLDMGDFVAVLRILRDEIPEVGGQAPTPDLVAQVNGLLTREREKLLAQPADGE